MSLLLIGCAPRQPARPPDAPDTAPRVAGVHIESAANDFAAIEWVLSADATMRFSIHLLDDQSALEFTGTWDSTDDAVVVRFEGEHLDTSLPALFGDHDYNAVNNVTLIDGTTLSIRRGVDSTWIYGVLCVVSWQYAEDGST
ncbi:MAG: hypothetical protein EA382_05875 [Spirochaetaceae bacterium]|nr:MAG: hypothetical protein EA382_05875 [Spirochaetaceae bacterium]